MIPPSVVELPGSELPLPTPEADDRRLASDIPVAMLFDVPFDSEPLFVADELPLVSTASAVPVPVPEPYSMVVGSPLEPDCIVMDGAVV